MVLVEGVEMPISRNFLAGCLAVAASALSIPALAGPGDYRWEAGLSYERRTFDKIVFPGFPGTFQPPDTDVWRASGRYYFQDVKTDDVPLSEAAYLGRNSSVALAWSRFDADFGALDSEELAIRLYVPKSIFYFAGGIARFETAAVISSRSVITDHDTDWYGVVGITPIDGLRITTLYVHDNGYDPNVRVKYVGQLGGSHFYGFGLEAVEPDEGGLSVSGDFDFFFDATLSIGLGYAERGDQWTLRAEKFFTPRLGVQASYIDVDGGEGFRVDGTWRF